MVTEPGGTTSTSRLKICPHMLRSDHRELRNRDLKLMWVVVGGGGWWVVVVVGVECKHRYSSSSASASASAAAAEQSLSIVETVRSNRSGT